MAEYIGNVSWASAAAAAAAVRLFITNEIITPESEWEEHYIISSAMAMERPLLLGV